MDSPKAKSFLSAAAIVGVGALGAAALFWTAPETPTEEPTIRAKIVQTIDISPRTERVTVSNDGVVIPSRRVVMRPEVRGRVLRQHEALVPGGFIEAGEELIAIDPAEYELALYEQEAALEEAKFELEVEQGRQVVASRELRLLEEELPDAELNRALVLREPHLRRIEAMIRKATNEISKAQLQLSRTSVRAPFNAMVLQESVDVGQLVEPGAEICTLVGTDEFWVQTTLPLDQLKWIQLPSPDRPGAKAIVTLDLGDGVSAQWDGQVVRLLSDLEPLSRMARVLVRVADPLGLDTDRVTPLLLDSYVKVDIDAGALNDVLVIPRLAMREGGRIWAVDKNNKLQIRAAPVLWSRGEELLIENVLKPDETLVVSGLRSAAPGMEVQQQRAEMEGVEDE